MSTTQPLNLDGIPIPPLVSRGALVGLTRSLYERSPEHLADMLEGDPLDGDLMDLHLAEVATRSARSLLQAQARWVHGGQAAVHEELLTAVAALRSILGYAPTPTPGDVRAWARGLWQDSAAKAAPGEDGTAYSVEFEDGPYTGVTLGLWGRTVAGPPLRLEVATEQGDTQFLERGTAHYRCRYYPGPVPRWVYVLDQDRPAPARGARPHMFPSQPGSRA